MEEQRRPFLSFYKEHQISPVNQELSDLTKHFTRRESLYFHLGIVPRLIEGKSVIEFGPGSGHNSIFTANLNPARYVLVDGNPTGLEKTKEIMGRLAPKNLNYSVTESLIENYESDEVFDIVLCEGVIQLQLDPSAFAQKVGGCAAPGGLFVLTCCDSVSFLSETLRRILASIISPKTDSVESRLSKLLATFSPDLDTLKGMSRKYEDYLLDTLIIPFEGKLFSIADAIQALSTDFHTYGASPNLFVDWRWYKDLSDPDRDFNQISINNYYRNLHNLMDYRSLHEPRDPASNRRLKKSCDELFEIDKQISSASDDSLLQKSCSIVEEIINEIDSELPETSNSLQCFNSSVEEYFRSGSLGKLDEFRSFFGRGMQYLSFVKR